MQIKGSVGLVTGGNRGVGKAFVRALLDAGAQKVYVGVRHPLESTDPRLQPLHLDITNSADIAAAVAVCQEINLLINNAGVWFGRPLIGAPSMEEARLEMETNYFGTLAMCRAFAPVLKQNGGGALVNMLSVASWFTNPSAGSYSVSKAAEWALTNGVRIELRSQGTLVVGVHAGFIETDMVAGLNVPKIRPEEVAAKTMEALLADQEEVLADRRSQEIKAALATDAVAFYRQIQESWERSKQEEAKRLSQEE